MQRFSLFTGVVKNPIDAFLVRLKISPCLEISGVGWIVIPLEVSIEKDDFFFHSWNLFVFICSLPALLTGAWLLFFPETPKYLAESGNNVQMLDVLMRMYSENSGEPPKEYIVSVVTIYTYVCSPFPTREIAISSRH